MKVLYIIILSVIFIILVIGIYFFNYSTNPKFSLKKLFKKKSMLFLSDNNSIKWFNNTTHKDIYLKSFDKLKLHSYEIKNKSNTWIIMVHGYTNNGLEILSIAQKFYNEGYSLLIIDQRAHGKSKGIYSTQGYNERKDLISWIKYLNRKKKTKIILYGISMGATVVMRTTSLPLPKNVTCAIEDCGFISNYNQYYEQLSFRHLPAKIIIFSSNIVSIILKKFNIYKFDPYKELEKGTIPMLFIHGKSDKLVKPYNAIESYKIYKGKKEILLIDDAKHMKSSIVNPEIYYSTIFKFINKYNKIKTNYKQ